MSKAKSKPKPKTVQINFRVTEKEARELKRLAETHTRGNLTAFILQAALAYAYGRAV